MKRIQDWIHPERKAYGNNYGHLPAKPFPWKKAIFLLVLLLAGGVAAFTFYIKKEVGHYNEEIWIYNEKAEAYNNLAEESAIYNIQGLPETLSILTKIPTDLPGFWGAVKDGVNPFGISGSTKALSMEHENMDRVMEMMEQIKAPSEDWVIQRLGRIPELTELAPVTKEKDPNQFLGVPGGYTSCLYFSYKAIDQKQVPGKDVNEKGTDAGGAVEVYTTKEDAEARCEYLQGFDGTLLYSGSYAIVGTMVIRTSYLLEEEEQLALTDRILHELTALS